MNLNPITFAPVFPAWLILFLFCLALAQAVIQGVVNRSKLGWMRALVISALRFAVIVVLVIFALNPSVVTREEHRISPAVAIIVDTSESMGQSDGNGKVSRLNQAKALLSEGGSPLIGSLSQKYEVHVYGLADSLRPLAFADVPRLQAAGSKGDLSEALKTIGNKNAVAVVLSDGNLKWNQNQAQLLPTVIVPFGDPQTYQDVLIKGISAPPLAFRDRNVSIEVTIKNYGYPGSTLPVLLKDSGRLLSAENVSLRTHTGETTVSLSFMPDEVGQKNLSISIPQQVGERIIDNNRVNLTIKVVPDKMRILMVSGNPSLNYRFMRTALKSDPSIDLLSFVILRTPADILNVRTNEQSLIPFPVKTLFLTELTNFDLLIFDNFNYAIYLRPEHLESIRKFVEGGGSFAMVGGPNLFDEGRFGLSPIGDILPVRFVESGLYQRDSPVRVRMGPAGTQHPILRFSGEYRNGDTDPGLLWREMSPLDGFNLMEAKPSAQVLLETSEGLPWPVLTVSEHGKGRVLALTTDYAWKWYMGMVASGKGNQHYLMLVHRMARWLTKDPSLDPVQMILPETAASTGQETEVRIRFQGGGASRTADEAISFSVFNPRGVRIDSKLKPAPQSGEHIVSFLPQTGGIFRIKVETPVGQLEESLVVAGELEGLDAGPDLDQLQEISTATQGKYIPQKDELIKEIEQYVRKAEKQFIEEKRLPIWASAFVMAIVSLLLCSEWYLRRRWGLI
jgi:uncharacterized membrane protein